MFEGMHFTCTLFLFNCPLSGVTPDYGESFGRKTWISEACCYGADAAPVSQSTVSKHCMWKMCIDLHIYCRYICCSEIIKRQSQ